MLFFSIKAEKLNENYTCNTVKEINSVENIVDTFNMFPVESVNNASGQHKHVEIFLYNIPVRMLVNSGSNVTLILRITFNKIKNSGHKLQGIIERQLKCQTKEIPVLIKCSVTPEI